MNLLLMSALLALAVTPAAPVQQPAAPGSEGVVVAAATLDELAGTYRVSPQLVLRVWREGGTLFLQADGQPRYALVAESESSFRVEGQPARISFGFGPDGKVSYLLLEQGGYQAKALRE